jgi:hypothetical protein
VLFRAYDMAAIKLKGYDRANTNFPKSQYHHEPFMVVRTQACSELSLAWWHCVQSSS